MPRFGFALTGVIEGDDVEVRKIMDELFGELHGVDNILPNSLTYEIQEVGDRVESVAYIRLSEVED